MAPGRALAFTWIAATVAVVLLNIAFPQVFGLPAMGAVFEPYLVLIGLFAAAVVLRPPTRPGLLLVVALIAIALFRYVPSWVSFPAPPAADVIRVSTWNMHARGGAAERALEGISNSAAQIMAIEELGPEAVAALGGLDRYPFKALTSDSAFLDVGLLSEFPIIETERSANPPFLRAVVDPPASDPIVVYAVHVPLARLIFIGGLPIGVNFSVRDGAIESIRSNVNDDLAEGRQVIIVGDFNMTERERGYGLISSGLNDAHLDAGIGPGLTWRPEPLQFVPFGMLRIDYVFSTPGLRATSSTVDCSSLSDHCRVDVELELAPSLKTD